MSVLAGIKSFLGGGLGEELVGFIRDRWPAKMSEEDKMQAELALTQFAHAKEVQLIELGLQQDQQQKEFTISMEGTAKDLQQFGFLGRVIIFARGMFRPVFAYFTMYLDYRWLVADTTGWGEQQHTALFVINVIVLVFFFGERSLKNLLPLIARVFGVTYERNKRD